MLIQRASSRLLSSGELHAYAGEHAQPTTTDRIHDEDVLITGVRERQIATEPKLTLSFHKLVALHET